MLYPGLPCGFAFKYDNWGANPATTYGTAVSGNASANVEGAWTQIASSANIAQNCYWIEMVIHSSNSSANAANCLYDIGVDPAGGTSYTAIINNIIGGQSPGVTLAGGPKQYSFPFFIKAGSSVAVRVQSSLAAHGNTRVAARFYGQPTNPLACPVGAFSQTFGTITNSSGPTVTPGNAADGTYVDLGSVTKALWWFQIGHQINNATVTAEYTYVETAWGDGSNKHVMHKYIHGGTTAEVSNFLSNPNHSAASFMPVPAGANLYCRMRCNNAPDTGYNVTMIGIGG
jgi:hypothetical protein